MVGGGEDSLCSGLVKEEFVELAPRRTRKGRTPESVPNLILNPLLDSGSPLRIHETDAGRIDLDGVSDGGVDDSFRATAVWSLVPNRSDQPCSVVGKW